MKDTKLLHKTVEFSEKLLDHLPPVVFVVTVFAKKICDRTAILHSEIGTTLN